MNTKTTIINAGWIIPVVPREKVLLDHAIVIENDKIIALCPQQDAQKKFPTATIVNKKQHAILPGFINCHTHAAMNLFKGIADDVPLHTWLEETIWPCENQWVTSDFVQQGTQLAIAEMLLNGTTCFNDMYYYPDMVAKIAQQTGIRAMIGLITINFPSVWAQSTDEYFSKGLQVNDDISAFSLVNAALAPHSPYMTDDDTLQKVLMYADELNLPIHMHIHESKQEITQSLEQYQERPLQRLHRLGLVNPRLNAVHMTQLTEQDIALCAENGVHIIHCPKSNLKLANGLCPISTLLKAGVNVALGTDGAASNNQINMLDELRFAALLAKHDTQDACAVPAWQALEMATINGAKALHIESKTGSLEIGKSADFMAIDLQSVHTTPTFDPISQIVYSAQSEQITDVWVNGKILLENRQLTTLRHSQLLQQSQLWQSTLAASL